MQLTEDQMEQIYAHARAAYPDECCGVILGPPSPDAGHGKLRLYPLRNVQNEFHERDPESYPRTARRAYLIEPFEFERILREAKESGEVLRGIFHSHPDVDAYFSQEDKDAAVPFGDVPSFPDAEHIVVSVRDREVQGNKVFRWDPEAKDFVEVELVVAAESGQ